MRNVPQAPPTLILFCGLPGAGKTTLARQLQAEGRGVRICTDDWQHQLGLEWSDLAFHERLQAVLYRHAIDLLGHGVDVILEDGLWLRSERREKFADARGVGARIEWHVLEADFDTLLHRLVNRNAHERAGDFPVTRDDLRRSWELFEPPEPDEMASVDRCLVHRPDGTPLPRPLSPSSDPP